MALQINVSTNSSFNKVIGTGIFYPVQFSDIKNDQLLDLVTGIEAINQSIRLILDTRRGERFNNPEFGSDIRKLIFEPNDQILKSLLYYAIITSIQRWEKRISILDISFASANLPFTLQNLDLQQQKSNILRNTLSRSQFDSVRSNVIFPKQQLDIDPHQINITIKYIINNTHTVGSYVYPFVRNAMPMNQVVQGHSNLNLLPSTRG